MPASPRPFAGNFPPGAEKATGSACLESPHPRTVLVLDDEGLIRWTMRERLSEHGYEVLEAETGGQALTLARTHHVDLALLDLQLPDMDGLAVLARLRAEQNPCAAIIMTAYGSPEVSERASFLGARACVAKPFDLDALTSLIDAQLA